MTCHGGKGAGFKEVVEGDGGGAAVLEGEKLLIVQRKEMYRCVARFFKRCAAEHDKALYFRKGIEHPLFVMIEDQFGDPVLFDERLKRQGVECVEDEVGLFQVDIERLFSPLLQVVQYQRTLAAASCSPEVDIAFVGEGGFAQDEVVVARRVLMVVLQQIHSDSPIFPFYKETIFHIVPFWG